MLRQNTNYHSWLFKRTIQTEVKYRARRERPATVTYVEIKSHQDVDSGKAVIVSGGIGQANIYIVVEIPNTDYIDCTATIYGKLTSEDTEDMDFEKMFL